MNAGSATGRVRRTQAERRAATRVAVLEATIDCLAEKGYAQTTTRRVAERADVTPGALQHHFDNKLELLGQTRQHLGRRWVGEMLADKPTEISSPALRNEFMIDRWWSLSVGRGSDAMVELLIAARTDGQLRDRLLQAERDNAHLGPMGLHLLYPELADRPGFEALIMTGHATLRGLAMLRFIDEAAAELAWPSTREHLVAQFSRFCESAGVRP